MLHLTAIQSNKTPIYLSGFQFLPTKICSVLECVLPSLNFTMVLPVCNATPENRIGAVLVGFTQQGSFVFLYMYAFYIIYMCVRI